MVQDMMVDLKMEFAKDFTVSGWFQVINIFSVKPFPYYLYHQYYFPVRYEGEFIQGWFHGCGTFWRADGTKFEGEC